ncbi:MAG: DNA polymerase III subunit delta [Clostridiales bacterium]|nr:DNA polymerase III subunit delta [Clostridiales bacterium]
MASKFLSGTEFMNVIGKNADDLRLVLLCGNEDYYIENCVKGIKKAFLAPGSEDMDLSIISKDAKFSFDILREYVEMPPWLSSRRLIICSSQSVYNCDYTDSDDEMLKSLPDSCVVVFVLDKADKNRKFTKAVIKYGVAAEINYFQTPELIKIIKDSLKKSGISVNDETAGSLVNRCESQMRQISSEIEKIRLYCKECGKDSVAFEDLESICPPDLHASVFTITDCFGSGKCDKALNTLNSLILRKEPVAKLRSTLFTHLKRLILAKDINNSRELMSRYKMAPFYAENLTRQASRFSMDQLFKLYAEAVKSESDFKHGLIDERVALETLIVKTAIR